MDITISTSELCAALVHAKSIVADKKSTMPILSTVLLEAQITPAGGRLVVRAYDLEIGLCTTHACEVKKEGTVAVPAKALAEIAKVLPETTARLKAAANNRLEVTSGGASFKLAGQPAADFPAMPAPEALHYENVDRAALKGALDAVAFAMSSDETRYNLNGVFIEATPDGVNLVATDGHRMSLYSLNNDHRYGLNADKGAIIPRKAVNELRKLLSEETHSPAELAFNENTLAYRRSGLTYTARLVDGQFPAYRQVMPKPAETPTVANRASLTEVLRRVMLMSQDAAQTVIFSLEDGKLTLSARAAEMGEAIDSLPVEYSGKEIKLGVNGRYMQDMLDAVGDAKLSLSIVGDLDPVLVQPMNNSAHAYVLMPVRT